MNMRRCSVSGCGRRHFARGFCQAHYRRKQLYGDPRGGRTEEGKPLAFLAGLVESRTDDCILWPFASREKGYGAVSFEGAVVGAHRAMCIIAHGYPDSPNLVAAHSCGMGHLGCVNPRHLRWATQSENQFDRQEHGKAGIRPPLAKPPNTKLDDAVVGRIRAELANSSGASVARKYGVSEALVSRIKTGERRRRAY